MELFFGEQFHDKFDTQDYLRDYYTAPGYILHTFPFPHLYNFYQSLGSECLRILEVGSGPAIAHVVSAALYASEIVLAEYTESNRQAVRQWLDKDPTAHDWRPFLKHIVVNVEGGTEKDIAVRKEKLRSSIKAVVPYDVNKDPLLPIEHTGKYDVVMSILCLESACQTRDDYVPALRRLACHLECNGKLVLYHVERKDSDQPAQYPVGKSWFRDIRLSKEFIMESLKAAGFSNITRASTEIPLEKQEVHDDPMTPAVYTATYTGQAN